MSDLINSRRSSREDLGGRQLETVFGYDIPEGPIGECWAISAHPNGDCQIAEGPYAGHTLSWLWAEHRELFGNCESKEFPLLIKILDAKDDLSIQIHPNDEYAAEHENGSLGKTECWYVLDCEPGATIIVGQRAHDRAEAAQMIEEGRWGDMLNVLPIHKGDFFQIDSGTVHAIKTGT
ncbi:MAG: type I phosphomannose isomerase catalytic subunit, partial [Collinsella sp.]